MGMVVRTNMAGLNANNALNMASKTQQNAMQKLASGFRINKAADDASGLAISEKMKNQIKALDTAADNCEDGANMIQTAEGYMNETHDILNRMTELAEKAANGVLDDTDRDSLQDEMDQLCAEIDRMASTANFNGHKLMDGSLGSKSAVKITGQKAGEKLGFEAPVAKSPQEEFFGGTIATDNVDYGSSNSVKCKVTGLGTANTGEVKVKSWSDITNDWDNEVTLTISAKEGDTVIIGADGQNGTTSNGLKVKTADANYKGSKLSYINGAWKDENDNTVTASVIGFKNDPTGKTFTSVKRDAGGNASTGINLQIGESSTSSDRLEITINSFHTDALFGGLNGVKNMENDTTNDVSTAAVKIKNSPANQGEGNVSSTYNNAVTIDITDKDAASAAADAIRQISNYVSDERGKLGAQQNRLEHTVNNLTTASENTTAANSRIRDTNMAEEMMSYTSKNVVAQAAQAMLAQANSQPQNVLSLLQ